jgi:quinol monooxygenase YgiN
MMDLDRRGLLQGAVLTMGMALATSRALGAGDDQVVVIAELVAKPGQEKALRDLLTPFAEQSRKEPGCLHYELLVVTGEPGRFLTVETWANKAAIDAHMSTPAIKAAIPMLGPILAKPFTQTFLTSISSS